MLNLLVKLFECSLSLVNVSYHNYLCFMFLLSLHCKYIIVLSVVFVNFLICQGRKLKHTIWYACVLQFLLEGTFSCWHVRGSPRAHRTQSKRARCVSHTIPVETKHWWGNKQCSLKRRSVECWFTLTRLVQSSSVLFNEVNFATFRLFVISWNSFHPQRVVFSLTRKNQISHQIEKAMADASRICSCTPHWSPVMKGTDGQ